MTTVSSDTKPSMHFSFEFDFVMEMDKDVLKGLASSLGVIVQQPDKIQWLF